MKKNIFKLSFLVLAALSFTGCLKDKHFDGNEYQSLRGSTADQKAVSIALTTTLNPTDADYNVSVQAFDVLTTSTVQNLIPITIAGGIPAEQDIHVVVDTSVALVDAYNTANGFTFDNPPAADYSIVSKTVTIPKGQSTGYMQIRLIPANFFGSVYALGVKIISVDGGYNVAANAKNRGVAGFTIKNAYEGQYSCTGIRTRYNGPTLASGILDNFPFTNFLKDFTTSGTTTIQGTFADGGSGVIADLTINPDNSVTITGLVGVTPAGSTINDPAHASSYDPATKTFTLYASYLNSAGNLRTANEVMVKK